MSLFGSGVGEARAVSKYILSEGRSLCVCVCLNCCHYLEALRPLQQMWLASEYDALQISLKIAVLSCIMACT